MWTSYSTFLFSVIYFLLCGPLRARALPRASFRTIPDNLKDCPMWCDQNDSKWTAYSTVDHLRTCTYPIWLDIEDTDGQIRACTIATRPEQSSHSNVSMDSSSLQAPLRIHTAPMAVSHGTYNGSSLSFSLRHARNALRRLTKPIHDVIRDEHARAIRFAYLNGHVASLYSGRNFHDATILSVSAALLTSMSLQCAGDQCEPGTTLFQLCGPERTADDAFGLIIGSAEDLGQVKDAAAAWSKADCFTLSGNNVLHDERHVTTWQTYPTRNNQNLRRSDKCKIEIVVDGDGCDTLTERCGIAADDFMKFNDLPDLCATLQPDQLVCCSAGTLPGSTVAAIASAASVLGKVGSGDAGDVPKAGNDDGGVEVCVLHKVVEDDTCYQLAEKYGTSEEEIVKMNERKTKNWAGCDALQIGKNICVGEAKNREEISELDETDETPKMDKAVNLGVEGKVTDKDPAPTSIGDDLKGILNQAVGPGPVVTDEEDDDDNNETAEDDEIAVIPEKGYRPGTENRPDYECAFFKPIDIRNSTEMCKEPCREAMGKLPDDEIKNYGCVGNFPLADDYEIPYEKHDGLEYALAMCVCNSEVVNYFFDKFIDAMAAIAEIGCFILTQAMNFMLELATDLIPGAMPLKLGLQGLVNAASYAAYTFNSDNDPEAAFLGLFNPCGSSKLVPADLKKGFAIANGLAGGGKSLKGIPIDKPPAPKWKRGSGKKESEDGQRGGKPEATKTKSESAEKTEACTLPDNHWLWGV